MRPTVDRSIDANPFDNALLASLHHNNNGDGDDDDDDDGGGGGGDNSGNGSNAGNGVNGTATTSDAYKAKEARSQHAAVSDYLGGEGTRLLETNVVASAAQIALICQQGYPDTLGHLRRLNASGRSFALGR
jgi:hypothetical protein